MRILVALDGSAFSEAVLAAVAPLSALGAEVTLTRVVNEAEAKATWRNAASVPETARGQFEQTLGQVMPRTGFGERAEPVEGAAGAGARMRQEAYDYLRDLSLERFHGRAETVVLEGDDVAVVLLTHALAERYDLLAMTTHGRTGLERAVMGSVANTVVAKGLVPVLLVRPDRFRAR